MTDFAKEARDLRSEVDRLTGLLGHIREHILTDEDFDADELANDIAGSVDLAEYDRLMRRAETAKAAGVAEGMAKAAEIAREHQKHKISGVIFEPAPVDRIAQHFFRAGAQRVAEAILAASPPPLKDHPHAS